MLTNPPVPFDFCDCTTSPINRFAALIYGRNFDFAPLPVRVVHVVPHHLHLHAGLAPGARVPEVPDARVLAELLRVRVAEVALEVGVGNGVVADRALATGVLEFLRNKLGFFGSFNNRSEKLNEVTKYTSRYLQIYCS